MKAIGNYIIERTLLGKGQYGEVYRAHAKAEVSKIYAVKIISHTKLSKKLFEYLKNEISILAKIESDNVVRLLDVSKTENNYYIFMEYCNGCDLEQFKMIRRSFSEMEARLILQQIVEGFKKIYENKVMHRDLKLANILIHFKDPNFRADSIKDERERKMAKENYFKNANLLTTDF